MFPSVKQFLYKFSRKFASERTKTWDSWSDERKTIPMCAGPINNWIAAAVLGVDGKDEFTIYVDPVGNIA